MIEMEDRDPGIDLATFDKEAEIAKFKDYINTGGWDVLVRLYTEPTVVKGSSVIRPSSVCDEGLYKNCTGLVVQQGRGVYTDERYAKTGRWCEIGDWIIFPRHAGYRVFVLGIPLWVLKEDAVGPTISDPRNVSKYTY